jgi:hypothetical protein
MNAQGSLNGARSGDLIRGVEPSNRAPALALNVEEACSALGVSWDVWRAHIEPDVAIVRLGRRKLIPVAELERWLSAHASRVLEQ